MTPNAYDHGVGFELHVDRDLISLADRLADRLSEAPEDPFTFETIVVPGAGVKAWLSHALAHRLGICANLSFTYPASLISTALGAGSGLGRWQTGPLTWAVQSLTVDSQRRDLLRSRAIADMFDRYTLYRPHMVRQWSDGRNVDGMLNELPLHHRWQPELWRQLEQQLGTSDAVAMLGLVEQLRHSAPDGMNHENRISIFGISSMPLPHLEVLQSLSRHVDIALFSPCVSPNRWRQQFDRSIELYHPKRRSDADRIPAQHRLNEGWARANEEGHLLLVDTARAAGGNVIGPSVSEGAPTTLLEHVQHSVRSDLLPSQAVVVDETVMSHRTYGAHRQVEVVRDQLLHLFDQTDQDGAPRYEPRDVVILMSDVERFAPLVEAVFSGHPSHGVPEIPVQIADRSVGVTNPIAAVALRVLDMLDGRFRLADVAALLGYEVVAKRFELTSDDASRLIDLLSAANARWGLDCDDQHAVGFEPLGRYTLLDALDRLTTAAVSGVRGPDLVAGQIAALRGVGFDDLPLLAHGALFVEQLRNSHRLLCASQSPLVWLKQFETAIRGLVAVDDDSIQFWIAIERAIGQLVDDMTSVDLDIDESNIDPVEMASLVASQLELVAGYPRFNSGRVTVSSLTALRGIPHKIVCVLGLDRESAPSGFANPDDLSGLEPCVGDRDAASEYRAQILDAVLAAQDHLIIASNGFSITNGAVISPSSVLAEFTDTLTSLTDGKFKEMVHQRQAWSEESFAESRTFLGHPWSHDKMAAEAAMARRDQRAPTTLTSVLQHHVVGLIEFADVRRAVSNPLKLFAERRLRLRTPSVDNSEISSDIAFGLGPLERYSLRDQLLASAVAGVDPSAWQPYVEASGDLPPFTYGKTAFDLEVAGVDDIVAAIKADGLSVPAVWRDVHIDHVADSSGARVRGAVSGVIDDVIVETRSSSQVVEVVLERIVDLAALTIVDPTVEWRCVIYAPQSSNGVRRIELQLRDHLVAQSIFELSADLCIRAMSEPIPWFPRVGVALARQQRSAAASEWNGSNNSPGLRSRGWNTAFFDMSFDDLERNVDLGAPVREVLMPLIAAVTINDSADTLTNLFGDDQ